MKPRPNKHSRVWCVALLVLVTILAFRGVSTFEYLNYDDDRFIVYHPFLQQPTLENIGQVLTPGSYKPEGLYIPVPYLLFMLEFAIFGENAGVMHVTNLLIHLINISLVYLIFAGLTGRDRLAMFGALIFALHPLQAEAVCWIMGRKDLLSTMFGLLCLIAAHRYGQSRSTGRWCLMALLMVLAILSKPSMLVLPVIIVMFTVSHDEVKANWRSLSPYAVLLCLAAVFFSLNNAGGPPEGGLPADALERIPQIGRGLCLVIGRFALVVDCNTAQLWTSVEQLFHSSVYLLGAGIVVGVVLWACVQRQVYAMSLAAFLIASTPALYALLVRAYDSFEVGNRFSYFPLIALALATIQIVAASRATQRRFLGCAFVVWIAVMVCHTPGRISMWRSSATLWQAVVDAAPHSVRAWRQLGDAVAASDPTRAKEAYAKAIENNPKDPRPRVSLGRLEYLSGNYAAAQEHFAQAVMHGGREPRLLENLALIHLHHDSLASAQQLFAKAIQFGADREYIGQIWLDAADVYQKDGDTARAIAAYANSADLAEKPAGVLLKLIRLYHSSGDSDKVDETLKRLDGMDLTDDQRQLLKAYGN